MDVVALSIVVLLYFPLQYCSIGIHEIGHYLVFRLLKVTPQWVDIGSGKMWFKFQYKGTWFQVKRLPFSGEVVVAPGHLKKMGLWGAITMLIAGPLLQLCFAVGLGTVSKQSFNNPSLQNAFWILSLVIAINAIQQLRPFRKRTERNGKKEEIRSDGFQIRNFWKRREQFGIINTDW